jgi:hypothetical protein
MVGGFSSAEGDSSRLPMFQNVVATATSRWLAITALPTYALMSPVRGGFGPVVWGRTKSPPAAIAHGLAIILAALA